MNTKNIQHPLGTVLAILLVIYVVLAAPFIAHAGTGSDTDGGADSKRAALLEPEASGLSRNRAGRRRPVCRDDQPHRTAQGRHFFPRDQEQDFYAFRVLGTAV